MSQYKNMKRGAQFSHPTRSMHQNLFPSQSGNKPTEQVKEKSKEKKKWTLQCWGCGDGNFLRDCPHRKHDKKRVYHVHEATTIIDVARIVPRIYVVVENWQENHQYYVVELEGIIVKQPISILIDLGYNLSYVSSQVFEACAEEKTCEIMVGSVS